MKHKVVLVDDEPLAIEVLIYYLNNNPDFEIIATITNPHKAVEYINSQLVSLVFLDIEMPTLNGLELLQQLTYKPLIIFTTAYKDYLQAGFDNGILDYLQKPIKKERLDIALQRAKEQLKSYKINDTPQRIYIKSGDKEILITIQEIILIKSAKDYCILFLEDNRKILVKTSMDAMLEKMGVKNDFVRVHKSFIINSTKIESIQNNKTIAIPPYTIPIGRTFKKAFYSHLESQNSYEH